MPTCPRRMARKAPEITAGVPVYTERTPRVAAARKLTRRAGRARAGRFLAEGAQAVREALAWAESGRGTVHELFVRQPDPELARKASILDIPVSVVTERAAAGLSETVTPQGIVAVCDLVDVPIEHALRGTPRLAAVAVHSSDPGNAGTLIRVADAAGADAVIFAGDSVDPHNGKCVRASTGSLFHLAVAKVPDPAEAVEACRKAGLSVLAADGHAAADFDAVDLSRPTGMVLRERGAWPSG